MVLLRRADSVSMAIISTFVLVAMVFFTADGRRDLKSPDQSIDKDHWTTDLYDQPQYRYLASMFGISRLQPSVQVKLCLSIHMTFGLKRSGPINPVAVPGRNKMAKT